MSCAQQRKNQDVSHHATNGTPRDNSSERRSRLRKRQAQSPATGHTAHVRKLRVGDKAAQPLRCRVLVSASSAPGRCLKSVAQLPVRTHLAGDSHVVRCHSEGGGGVSPRAVCALLCDGSLESMFRLIRKPGRDVICMRTPRYHVSRRIHQSVTTQACSTTGARAHFKCIHSNSCVAISLEDACKDKRAHGNRVSRALCPAQCHDQGTPT